ALFSFVHKHHEKEESALFPWLSQQNWLCQGGPRCGFYMGLRLENSPLNLAEQALRSTQDHFKDFHLTNHAQPDWLTASSPVSVPMEEHVVGDHLQQGIRYLLNMRENLKLQETEVLKTLILIYLRLLDLHLKKEKECLFVMCKQRLS
ncbi:MAG TPA: hypothetical protein VN132_01560, partial [Bdellovibrio sp.]|nr:hypothetical protein [Bdellovibrio sp.]